MTEPIAAWGFDEGEGTTAADATGGGGDLTLDNATWTTGHFGAAIENTASGAGASGSVPEITTPAVTLMSWVTPLDLSPGSTHWICGVLQDDTGNTDIALWTQRGDFGTTNVLQGNIRIGGPTGNLTAVNGTALTVDEEAHVALTYDGTTIRLYLNAEQIASASVSGSISLGTAFHAAGAPGIAGPGVVDEERYFAAALDPTEIAALMDTPVNSAVPVPEATTTVPVEITIDVAAEMPTAAVPEAGVTLPVTIGFDGVAEMPAASIPEATAALPVTVAVQATAEAPAATVPEAATTVPVTIAMTVAAETPPETVPSADVALPIVVDVTAAAEAPAASIPEATVTLLVVITFHGHAGQRIVTAGAPRLTIVPNRARLTTVPNRATATHDPGGTP